INLISYFPNRGKTHAVKTAFLATKNEWVMMIDSDLLGIEKRNITDLIAPVVEGNFDVSMTLRKNSLSIFRFLGLDFVSGERVFKKNLISDFSLLDNLPGFGLEVFLNGLIVEKKLKIAVVDWENVITPRKSVKYGFWAGFVGDIKMVFQIVKVMGVFGIVEQFRKMFSLRKVVRGRDF
ncbi:glycosyl transferase, partial [Candidatus Peregrinibacteria bacterium CG_4_9_14_0_2_um_filter_38_9]